MREGEFNFFSVQNFQIKINIAFFLFLQCHVAYPIYTFFVSKAKIWGKVPLNEGFDVSWDKCMQFRYFWRQTQSNSFSLTQKCHFLSLLKIAMIACNDLVTASPSHCCYTVKDIERTQINIGYIKPIVYLINITAKHWLLHLQCKIMLML